MSNDCKYVDIIYQEQIYPRNKNERFCRCTVFKGNEKGECLYASDFKYCVHNPEGEFQINKGGIRI